MVKTKLLKQNRVKAHVTTTSLGDAELEGKFCQRAPFDDEGDRPRLLDHDQEPQSHFLHLNVFHFIVVNENYV